MNRFLRFLGPAVLLLIFPFILCGQIQPQFEVVAIKPAGELTPDSTLGLNTDGAQTHISWASMTDLITMAYRIKRYQVSGPSWIGSERFDVVAKLPDGVSLRNVPEMLQSMLQERFGLKAHREKKELSVYNLGLSKPVPDLKEEPAPEHELTSFPIGKIRAGGSFIDWGGDSTFTFSNNTLEVKKLPLDPFCEWFSNFLDRPVINTTGLTGYYDFHMGLSDRDFQTMWVWAVMAGGVVIPPQAVPNGDALTLDSLSTGLKGIGLKLERGKGPVDILVIDTIQKKPSDN